MLMFSPIIRIRGLDFWEYWAALRTRIRDLVLFWLWDPG